MFANLQYVFELLEAIAGYMELFYSLNWKKEDEVKAEETAN